MYVIFYLGYILGLFAFHVSWINPEKEMEFFSDSQPGVPCDPFKDAVYC